MQIDSPAKKIKTERAIEKGLRVTEFIAIHSLLVFHCKRH